MRDAAGQLADRLELAYLLQRRLGAQPPIGFLRGELHEILLPTGVAQGEPADEEQRHRSAQPDHAVEADVLVPGTQRHLLVDGVSDIERIVAELSPREQMLAPVAGRHLPAMAAV